MRGGLTREVFASQWAEVWAKHCVRLAVSSCSQWCTALAVLYPVTKAIVYTAGRCVSPNLCCWGCGVRRFSSPDQVAFLARCVRRLDPITEDVLPEAALLCHLIIQVRCSGPCSDDNGTLCYWCVHASSWHGGDSQLGRLASSVTTCTLVLDGLCLCVICIGVCAVCAACQAGLARFPGDPTVLLLYANYIIHVKKEPRAARQQLQLASKGEPNLIERYNIFSANVRTPPFALQNALHMCACLAWRE